MLYFVLHHENDSSRIIFWLPGKEANFQVLLVSFYFFIHVLNTDNKNILQLRPPRKVDCSASPIIFNKISDVILSVCFNLILKYLHIFRVELTEFRGVLGSSQVKYFFSSFSIFQILQENERVSV